MWTISFSSSLADCFTSFNFKKIIFEKIPKSGQALRNHTPDIVYLPRMPGEDGHITANITNGVSPIPWKVVVFC